MFNMVAITFWCGILSCEAILIDFIDASFEITFLGWFVSLCLWICRLNFWFNN